MTTVLLLFYNIIISGLFITDLTQCQDGVTNNCTQKCTRDADTEVYNCSCHPGYQIDADHDTLCSGILS